MNLYPLPKGTFRYLVKINGIVISLFANVLECCNLIFSDLQSAQIVSDEDRSGEVLLQSQRPKDPQQAQARGLARVRFHSRRVRRRRLPPGNLSDSFTALHLNGFS